MVPSNSCLRLPIACALLSALGCSPRPTNPPADPSGVVAAVDSAMSAYLAAQGELDGAQMGTFYLDAPEFEAIMNGTRQDLVATRSRAEVYYSGIKAISGEFGDRRITPLGADAALVSAVRDQTMTDTAGVAVRYTGAASWVWVQREGVWRIVHINSHFDQTVLP